MRKTFLSICTAVFALLALSSCGKIWDEFGSVKTELDKINDRITALEEKLNSEVATINSAISAINATLKTVDADITALEALCTQLGVKDAELEKAFKDAAAALEKGDEGINAEIDELTKLVKDALADLDKADETLEEQANKLVDEIKKAMTDLEAKIAITDITTNEKGEIVLTLKDGSKLTVSNVENSGLVTIVKDPETEESYWGLVQKDGTVESLGIPVGTDVEFDVTDDYELVLILNGEEIRTGAYVNEGDSTIITSVEEYETYAIITIGDVEYVLPKYMGETTFLVKAGKTVFEFEETKEFEIAVDGIKEFYVMTKPDGWKAKLSGKKLFVTAPAEANEYADEEGEILLHGTNENGNCVIGKLAVTTASEGFIEVLWNEANDSLRFELSVVGVQQGYDPMEGSYEYFDFAQIQFGFAEIDDWNSYGPEGYFEALNNYDIDGINAFIDYMDGYPSDEPYDEVENPVRVFNTTIEDLYLQAAWMDDELPLGSRFVIWFTTSGMNGPELENLVYFYYSPVVVEMSEPEVTFNGATFDLKLYGAEQYFVGMIPETDFAPYGLSFDEYMQTPRSGSPWEAIKSGYGQWMCSTMESGTYEDQALNTFGLSEYMESSPLAPNTAYYVYVVPVVDGKDFSEYVYEEDCRVFEIVTEPLVAGGAATVSVTESSSTIKNITAALKVEGECETIYYSWYSAEDLADFESDEDLIDDMTLNGYMSIEKEFSASYNVSKPGAAVTMTLVAFTVDAEGKYGAILEHDLSTIGVPYTEDYVVTVASSVYDETNEQYTVTFDVAGGATNLFVSASMAKPRLQSSNDTYYTGQFDGRILDKLSSYYSEVAVVDGKAVVVFPKEGTRKYVYAVACTYAEDGSFDALSKTVALDVVTPAAE